MADNETIRVFIEAPSGERFEADVPRGTKLSRLAADFFEDRRWPMQDHRGRGQRAVVELVNPDNPEDTKRLNGDQDVEEAGVREGDTLRIFPESIAGAVDPHARLTALISDHNDLQALSERNPRITFVANRSHAPDRYEVTFHYPSFIELVPGEREPRQADTHRAEIILGADYPRHAPFVTWLTPIFHPNIRPPEGMVCLGVLRERYLPGLGLARLVRMLAEMVQWRNFDAFHPFNREAAEWAANVDNWPLIEAIGGHPLQGPIEQFLKQLDRAIQPPIRFTRLSSGG
jgi:ubiquitin-protein ligase